MHNVHACPFQDPALPVEDRVADLLSRLTLAEKIGQMVHEAAAIDRLNIPDYNWWNECLHGVARAGIATVFPQAIGLAATWDVDLMGQVATAVSDEARAKHHEFQRRGIHGIYAGLTFWSPNVNIFRDPRWGRGQETYGEDPYLAGRMGVAFVKGLQGDDPRYLKVVATPKHFAVHSGPESQRHTFDARVDERDLRETYLPAFEACVTEARAASVMGAYNRTNGEACCASPTLLDGLLRKEWGFDGYVVSDCWAINDIFGGHGIVATPAEAAAQAVKAGCDLECGCAFEALGEAVAQGLIGEADVDRALARLLRARFRLGMFDPPELVPHAQIPYEVNGAPAHHALARHAAQEAIVLLKNDGLLPLRKDLTSIAVIGPNAHDLAVLLGNYHGTPAEAVTPLDGIRRKVSPATTVFTAVGCELAPGVTLLRPIPPDCLRPAHGVAQAGLSGAYFANAELQGEPALVRNDSCVDFIWSCQSPLMGPAVAHFSTRWTGVLIPPVSGAYRLGVSGSSDYALFLDGRELLPPKTHEHEPALRAVSVDLEAGRLYDLRLEYWNRGRDPQVHLVWGLSGFDFVPEALSIAAQAEIVVLALGLSPLIEGEEMEVSVEGFSGGDRTAIGLPRSQQQLLEQVVALGKPVVLVLLNGGALAVPWADAHVPAIVEAWYPGEQGGAALADVLFGDANPSGRLPFTVYRSIEQLPPFDDYRMAGRTYRYLAGDPLYPFGHGLSYTRFDYADLRAQPAEIDPQGSARVSLDVTNRGDHAGEEVVQLYVRHPASRVARPRIDLKGFARVSLAPGETRRIKFDLPARRLAYWGDGAWVVSAGLSKSWLALHPLTSASAAS